jgi:O-antigen/teichoic acid export membrane protein
VANVKSSLMHLSVFQIGYLLFGSIPSIVLAYLGGAQDVGLFSFALTLSAFVYAGLAPVNEQIFSPTFSRLVKENDRRGLLRRVLQMQAATLTLGGVGSLVVFFSVSPLLRLLHKLAFLGSFRFLPPLLAYQVLLMCASGFTYPLFCMNRFKALAVIYGAPAVLALVWVLWTRGNAELALRALPLSSLAINFLGAVWIWRLVSSDAPLLRRSLIGVSA